MVNVRRPTEIECLYLDFDGFFASVEQTVHPELRGRPIGVVPFTETDRTCVIAASREAKLAGIGNAMPVAEARARCADILLVPQSPHLYRRAHNTLLSEISAVEWRAALVRAARLSGTPAQKISTSYVERQNLTLR